MCDKPQTGGIKRRGKRGEHTFEHIHAHAPAHNDEYIERRGSTVRRVREERQKIDQFISTVHITTTMIDIHTSSTKYEA